MKQSTVFASLFAGIIAIGLVYLGMRSRPQESERVYTPAELPPTWTPEVLKAFEAMPLADRGGRVKSFATFAHYELLRTRSYPSLSLKVQGEAKARKFTPTAWLLDVLFYPNLAAEYPVFIVEDSEAIARLGISPHAKQRDRYTYNEIKVGREALIAAAQKLSNKKAEDYDRIERLTYALAQNLVAYENLAGMLDAGRTTMRLPDDVTDPTLKPIVGRDVPIAEAISSITTSETWKTISAARAAGTKLDLPAWLAPAMQQIDAGMRTAGAIRWYAPSAAGKDDWETPVGLLRDLAEDGPRAPTAAAMLKELATLATAASNLGENAAFQSQLATFATTRIAEAKDVKAYDRITADVLYLKADLFNNAKWLFLVLFILVAISWLMRAGNKLERVVSKLTPVAYLLIIGGIFFRVWITGFGPVTSIYETIPFITLMGGLFALLMRRVLPGRIPVAIAVIVGLAGMFIAGRYETSNAEDTIGTLQAVLRSNYWLWTHVTTINLGYATVMLASVFSMVYIFARIFDPFRQDKVLCTNLTRCVYGILCFGLVFSIIGTILGGIWGNDSWGRFWGWDPKENGALLIVLWCLVVLHMRMAGWIKEFGLHIWSTLGAIPVLFSWWHVNLLGVGLHSYGFTAGLDRNLYTAYGIVASIVLIGIVISFLEKSGRARRSS
jgi:ABC-type transport system involved in cytochrome c biogenesis permease subunit